jgi:hypothetical protein
MLVIVCFLCGFLSRSLVGALSLGLLLLVFGVFVYFMPELAKSGGSMGPEHLGFVLGQGLPYFAVLIIGHVLRRLLGLLFGRGRRKKPSEAESP